MKNPTLVAGYGRVGGHLVALVANNGNLDKDAAKKVMSQRQKNRTKIWQAKIDINS